MTLSDYPRTVQANLDFSHIQPSVWLPPGKVGAICFSIDDVHPGRSIDGYDGGGDLGAGALGMVRELLVAHQRLRLTLFVTPDWREISPTPSWILRRIPVVRRRMYLTKILPKGTRSLVRHPEFVDYIRCLPRTNIELHGLHHVHRGPLAHVEFQKESAVECRKTLNRALAVFADAGLPRPAGMCPPGWNAPPGLLSAMSDMGFCYVASARDIKTEASPSAIANMSGLRGVSLVYPTLIGKRLVHFTSNFQATSPSDRAFEILEHRGILAIKAHIIKNALGHVALDGVDPLYCNYLSLLFRTLDREYGERVWWTTFQEIAERIERVRETKPRMVI